MQLNNCNIINTLMKSMIQCMRHENFLLIDALHKIFSRNLKNKKKKIPTHPAFLLQHTSVVNVHNKFWISLHFYNCFFYLSKINESDVLQEVFDFCDFEC